MTPNLKSALDDFETARHHLRSAIQIAASDPIGAFQLTYGAARKALQVILLVHGVRITARGGHFAFVRVAESSAFKSASFMKFREMRILRNQAEYPSPDALHLTSEMIEEAQAVTSEMLIEIWGLLELQTNNH